ncbi:hypothetical protein WICPIJ_008887 [Wickerhamomyces pijperi]|uniref:DH domain-containing protein n=1 Tax=Wickerhamomyces pijperi TaxID=599730 RepID=A0A9P8PVB6_WICPI|nr:hypothetical protein WICPIJ_008887 [Wickerhamomyces pijperi]
MLSQIQTATSQSCIDSSFIGSQLATAAANIVSRPPSSSAGSIQSSNPDLFRIDTSFYLSQSKLGKPKKRKLPEHKTANKEEEEDGQQKLQLLLLELTSGSNVSLLLPENENMAGLDPDTIEDHGLSLINETTSPLFRNIRSPLSVGGCPTDIVLDTQETDLEFINDLPNSLITFAYQKISAELAKSAGSLGEYTEFTRSSQLSPNGFLHTKFEALSPTSKRLFTRRNVIEEIIDTEEAYVSSLKMLSGIYLGSIISKGNNGIPVRQLLQYVDLLIHTHESFLCDLRKLYSISYRAGEECNSLVHTFPNSIYSASYGRAQSLITPTSPLMAALVGELMSKKLIGVYIYQEYSSIHDSVLKLINSKEDDPEIGKTLTRGYQHFLEASQGSNGKMDLSLGSLIQRPIGRLGRYKLFLETLVKLTPADEDEASHLKLQASLASIDYSIKEVNRYGAQEKIRANTLYKNLNFESGAKLNFPVEYLGMPLLLGSLHVSWAADTENHITTELLGAFLFKTHLILATVNKSTNFEVRFLVPLSVSKLVESFDTSGGIFTDHENSFKLRFETNFTIVELLLTQANSLENAVWKDKLDILINHVNGPYPLDYSASKFNEEQGTNSSTIIPSQDIQFYDAKVDRVRKPMSIRSKSYIHLHYHYHRHNDKSLDIFNRCYFSVVIPVKVEKSNSVDNYGSMRFKSFKSQIHQSTESEDGNSTTQVVLLKDIDKVKIETHLEDLWSEELLSATALAIKKGKPSSISRNPAYVSHTGSKGKKPKRKDHHEQSLPTEPTIPTDLEELLEKPLTETCPTDNYTNGGTVRSKKSSTRVSLIRRTSIVFGDALKSILNGSSSSSTTTTTSN